MRTVPILDLRSTYLELKPELDAATLRVLDSGRYLFGHELESFESEYARSVGAAHCLGVANGLEALQLILMAAGIGPGDEVIVPSNGYIATWIAVTTVGATIVPCEPDETSYNLDPRTVAAAITERTRAILPIHLYGQTADMDPLMGLAAGRKILVIEDAAQSHGALYHGRAAGALGHAAGVSFYPSKNLGAFADAGAVTTGSAELADKIRHLRNYGSKVRYVHEYVGMNSRLDETQAAVLRVKLRVLSEWNARRAACAKLYLEGLSGIPELGLPALAPGCVHAWHLFVVRCKQRDALAKHLAERGVGSQIHYPIPPHLSKAYASLGKSQGAYPIAEAMANEVLSLPIGPHLSPDDVSYVVEQVCWFFLSR